MMLEDLRAANAERKKERDPEARIGLLYLACELAGEAGEACNIVKKLERERLRLTGSRASVGDLARELADVVIVADMIASAMGIDLSVEVPKKFNETSDKLGFRTTMRVLE